MVTLITDKVSTSTIPVYNEMLDVGLHWAKYQ